MLADTLRELPGVTLQPDRIDSNIVIFELSNELPTAQEIVKRLELNKLRAMVIGQHQIRLVTHLDIDRRMIDQACKILRECVADHKTVTMRTMYQVFHLVDSAH